MNLQNYINGLSQHGTHRTIATLVGDQIPVKRLCKALKMRIKDYIGLHQHRVAWFKTTQGVVLMVSGNRVVAEVVDKFLQTYAGAYQEHQVLYAGVGVKIFERASISALVDYVPGNRSYGASR